MESVPRSGLARLDYIFQLLSKPLGWLAALLVGLIMLHVVAEVLSRLIMHQSLEGTTEIVSYYYMVGVVFLPLLGAKRGRELITAEILSPFMPSWLERILDAIADLLLSGWFLFFAWVTTEEALRATASGAFVETTTSILTIWPARWILPFAGLIVGLSCLVSGLRILAGGADNSHTSRSGDMDQTT